MSEHLSVDTMTNLSIKVYELLREAGLNRMEQISFFEVMKFLLIAQYGSKE